MQIGINKNKLQKLSQMSFLLKFYPAKLSSYTLPSQHATMHSVLMWATKVNYKLITYGSFYAIQVLLGAICHTSYTIQILYNTCCSNIRYCMVILYSYTISTSLT